MSGEVSVEAWHFLRSDRKLRYDDNREVTAGSVLTVTCNPILCQQGLHASVDIRDALNYAPGNVISRVIVSGDVVLGPDKIAGQRRECLWLLDVRWIIAVFARDCAERVRGLRYAAYAAYANAANAANAAYANAAYAYAADAANAYANAYANANAASEKKWQSQHLEYLVNYARGIEGFAAMGALQ